MGFWGGMPVKTADGAGDADGGGEYAQPPTWSTLVNGRPRNPVTLRLGTKPSSETENTQHRVGAELWSSLPRVGRVAGPKVA